jgi:hypothetical protein
MRTDTTGFAFYFITTRTWHSYKTVMNPVPPQARILSDKGDTAFLEFYESPDDNGVTQGSLFSTFTPGLHPEAYYNNMDSFWCTNSHVYAGLSTVPRGADTGETNTPQPAGVTDLQLHPPDNNHLTVAAFIAPLDGDYSVYDLAVRRVSASGNTAILKLFNSSKAEVKELRATNNRAWVTAGDTASLGYLGAGERIYFGMDRDGDYGWDAVEIAWSVQCLSSKSGQLASEERKVSIKFAASAFPNPFNPGVMLQYNLPQSQQVSLALYDVRGRQVWVLLNRSFKGQGSHCEFWNGKDAYGKAMPSGIYLVKITAGKKVLCTKVLLNR